MSLWLFCDIPTRVGTERLRWHRWTFRDSFAIEECSRQTSESQDSCLQCAAARESPTFWREALTGISTKRNRDHFRRHRFRTSRVERVHVSTCKACLSDSRRVSHLPCFLRLPQIQNAVAFPGSRFAYWSCWTKEQNYEKLLQVLLSSSGSKASLQSD